MSGREFLKPISHSVSLCCFLAVLAPAVAPAQEPPPRPFLRKVVQLDDAQLAAIEKGEVVTKILPTTDKPEIAAFGVVKAAGTVDQLLTLAGTCRSSGRCLRSPRWAISRAPRRSRI